MNIFKKIFGFLQPAEHESPQVGIAAPTIILIPESQKDGEKLTGREMDRMRQFLPGKLICPDCVMDSLMAGPQGGGCINVYCTNINCLSKFNDMGPFGWQRISDREPAKQNRPKLEPQSDDSFKLQGNL